MAKVRARLWVSGFVQGVFYRHNMRLMADSLGVTGWVRNSFDGRVEAIAEGEEASVNRLIEWCRIGPPAAEVDDVQLERADYAGEFTGFQVRR